jgi:hypothetical protein
MVEYKVLWVSVDVDVDEEKPGFSSHQYIFSGMPARPAPAMLALGLRP